MATAAAAPADALRPVDAYRDRVAYFLNVRGLHPRDLRADELRAYGWPAAGWTVTLPTAVGARDVEVLLPLDYPYKPARIGVRNLGARLPSAHIADDLMCLVDSVERHPIRADEAVLERDLNRAAARFADDNATVTTDRAGEFADYWNRAASSPPIYTLITEENVFGPVVAWHGKRYILVGADERVVRDWFHNRFNEEPTGLSCALYLPGKGISTRFDSVIELRAIVEELGDARTEAALEGLAAEDVRVAVLIFRLPGPFALVGATLNRGPRPGGAYKRKTRHPGFRPGFAPRKLLVDAYFAAGPTIEHHRLQRVDRDWIIARGGEAARRHLKDATVCLVGVGSLGSGVARALVKAGVGSLILIDPDVLTWDNIARHELGGRHVSSSKATAFAETLRQDFPFARVDAKALSWQDAYRADPAIFDVDVVLSTTGDWPAECQLNKLLRRQARATVAFGWIEPHAAAAHLLVVREGGGCLACGMHETGEFAARAVDWPEAQQIRVPACGASYVPYSDLAASRARAMVAGEVLNVLGKGDSGSILATELYDESLRTAFDGLVTQGFTQRLGREPSTHGDFLRANWVRHPKCEACASKGAQSAA
jgi:sulfur-carrier protein adenylyltransferase/sulfurtransferase